MPARDNSGPPPTPTAILKLRGSWRAKDPNRADEPQPPDASPPEAPEGMTPEAKVFWGRLADEMLGPMGLMTNVDEPVLHRYVEMFAKWCECRDFIASNGMVYPIKNSKGDTVGIKAFPQSNMMLKLNEQLLRIEAQFGLTPSARRKLAGPKKTEESAFDRMRRGAS